MEAQVDNFAKLAMHDIGKCMDEAGGEFKFSTDILPTHQLFRVAGPQLTTANVLVVKHAAWVPK